MTVYNPYPDYEQPQPEEPPGLLRRLLSKRVVCASCGATAYVKGSLIGRAIWYTLLVGVVGGFAVLVYFAAMSPETAVIPGRQVPVKYLSQIKKLNLLEPNEQIQYFYSDAMGDIRKGLYLVTDQRVVIYSTTYGQPAILVPYAQIKDVQASFSDSWVDDTTIVLQLRDDSSVSFPASMEGGYDRAIVDFIKGKANIKSEE